MLYVELMKQQLNAVTIFFFEYVYCQAAKSSYFGIYVHTQSTLHTPPTQPQHTHLNKMEHFPTYNRVMLRRN